LQVKPEVVGCFLAYEGIVVVVFALGYVCFYVDVIDPTGTLHITWGFASGAYLFIVAFATKIAAAILTKQTRNA